ncbi:MAG: alpha,alpha-trehalase TreF [Bacteroidota bacterium]
MDLQTPDQIFQELFEAIQLSMVFPDSKTFADSTPKRSAEDILKDYRRERDIENFDLKLFVHQNFDPPIQYASGFVADPERSPSDHIKVLWDVLERKADTAVSGSSLIALPNPYIVPGGRFGEIYYWDSYFTMLGMAIHEEWMLIKSMIDNFAYLINTFGHAPNGNRTYFLSRSQPPFFTQMVRLLAKHGGPVVFEKYHAVLKKEYSFWMSGGRRVVIGEYVVNRHWDDSDEPRMESYPEDIELAETSGRAPGPLYRDLRAACESGWDFSSRWFADGKNFSTIEATKIIPVDLNALLYDLESLLADLEPDPFKKKVYQHQMASRKAFLNQYCWNPLKGIYEDYHIEKQRTTGMPTLATLFPLFFNLSSEEQAAQVSKFTKTHFLKDGGVVTSLINSGQQWDAPNGWAPLQWITVKGLDNYGQIPLARQVAQNWVNLNEKVYQIQGKFVEKYNVEDINLDAGGGEYDLQDGFGWTNGVYLKLIEYLNLTNIHEENKNHV